MPFVAILADVQRCALNLVKVRQAFDHSAHGSVAKMVIAVKHTKQPVRSARDFPGPSFFPPTKRLLFRPKHCRKIALRHLQFQPEESKLCPGQRPGKVDNPIADQLVQLLGMMD